MEFRETTLENGLEVIAECNPEAYTSAFGFFVKTGSRDESDPISGVSHFLEHMVFKGTNKRSAADVNRELDEMGSQSNAFTSEEQTVYYAAMLPERHDHAVELLSDIMRPALREDDFNVEKKVILEEIAKYEDQPPFGASEKCVSKYFGAHPLGRNVLGTTDSVGALTVEQMREYFRRRYSPGNMCLVASGNVDFDRLVSRAKEHCGAWERVETHRDTTRAMPIFGQEKLQKQSAKQSYAIQTGPGPSSDDPERFAARVLATIVGDDSGSRLFWELVDKGRVEYAAMSSYEFQGSGIVMTFVCCAPTDVEANLETIDQLFEKVQAEGVSDEELKRAKNKISAQIVLQSERAANRLFSVGGNWLARREYWTTARLVQAFQSVTLGDIRKCLERFPLLPTMRLCVGPIG